MLPPVRCFTCNALLRFKIYEESLLSGSTTKDALDSAGARRMCCRRMLMTHPPELEECVMAYPSVNFSESVMFLDVKMKIENERTFSSD